MKRTCLLLAISVLAGCQSPHVTPTPSTEAPQPTVFDELTTALTRAADAKAAEESKLVQFAAEKKQLVASLQGGGRSVIDLAATDTVEIEHYFSQVDAESAKNVCLLLALEAQVQERTKALEQQIRTGEKWLEACRLYMISGAQEAAAEEMIEVIKVIEKLNRLADQRPRERPIREIDGRLLKQELLALARREAQQKNVEDEQRRKREAEQKRQDAIADRDKQLANERHQNCVLREQLATLTAQHQRLRGQFASASRNVKETARQLDLVRSEIVGQRESVSRLSRERAQLADKVRQLDSEQLTAKKPIRRDQTPLPMARYGHWPSSSGYRYGY